MKKWSVRYWKGEAAAKSEVLRWIDKLTKEQVGSVLEGLAELEIAGPALRMPHSKALGDGLFELREREYGYRLYYGFRKQQIIIVFAAGNKSSQQRDIKKARERLLSLK